MNILFDKCNTNVCKCQTKVFNTLILTTMKKTETTVNHRIDEIMLDRGMTKEELAAKAGKNVVTIDRILNGINTPAYGTVKAIAEAMNCPVDYLIKGTGPKIIPSATPNENPWKDEAWVMARQQLGVKDELLKSLAQSFDRVTKMMQDSGVSFLQRVNQAG